MGTRADFYVGRGAAAEWLGSIGYDGYPDGAVLALSKATTEAEYREAVAAFLEKRDDATLPADGWPWPWEDSRTTDYAYAFDGGKVWASGFGHQWFPAAKPLAEDPDSPKDAVFPDMTQRQAVATDQRSGMMLLTTK